MSELLKAPKQKTFRFEKDETIENIDKTVNDWMLSLLKTHATMPLLSKNFSNHATGQIYYVYIYTDETPAIKN